MVTKCGAGLEEATKKKLVEDEARRNVLDLLWTHWALSVQHMSEVIKEETEIGYHGQPDLGIKCWGYLYDCTTSPDLL